MVESDPVLMAMPMVESDRPLRIKMQMFTDEPLNLANHTTLPGSKRIPGGMSKRCVAPLMANFM